MRLVTIPVFLGSFLQREFSGAQMSLWKRLCLVYRFRRNCRRIETASHWLEHLQMAGDILDIPPEIEGVVVECGCFKGGSTANLSLACAITGRTLQVYDSFQGLPAPSPTDRVHTMPFVGRTKVYEQGQYRGELAEVRATLQRFGNIDSCEFWPGLFSDTLPNRREPVVLAFLDVDLHDSLSDCLVSIWPRLQPSCKLYSHEAGDLDFTARFFDQAWWSERVGHPAPGFIGVGTGLPVLEAARGGSLGYCTKPQQPSLDS